ncbi:hypothetical protein I6E68_10010 [Salinibacterium sp. NSLL150]|uniref:hypothetical protein n=1 Tax=unclassified Salinibacterium TaxID=2632331 RepID=UPI0018CCE759|nr:MULTISPECIES: hypothetical protein [unclassified Salinibacterium]MBH0099470.1 hypothetical protein [Salinibacterium sp. NSLL35]MBH0102224.1 hypothetical protein [Salinibacterium sp. NSLL150]MBH0104984.1 hypothetical protein [Salinibacterium sp. NSLL16]MBH0107744.1 hypothetical protein [Salinibacterium sp. NSLL17]
MRLPNLVRVSGGVLLLVLLSGCVPSDATPPPEQTASFVAPYASDEEALAAAEEAYAEYSRVSDEILIEGGADPQRLGAVATGDFLNVSIEEMREFEAEGYRATGITTYSDLVLQRYSPGAGPIDIIGLYLCSDVSGTDVLDAAGKSIIEPTRDDVSTMQVTFTFIEADAQLVVSDQQLWESGVC